MLADARSVAADSTLETDVCIIGAGAAGIALALRFEGSGVKTTILESGGEELDAETQALYQGPVTGLPYFPLDAARLRFFGGSTNHWGGVCRPFDEVDFEPRDWIPGSGWPIRLRDVAPYYERAGEICQVSTDDWDLETWVERDRYAPYPFDPERVTTRVAQIVPKSKRSFAEEYEEDIEDMTDVTVLLGANVTALEVDEDGRAVTEAAVSTLDGHRFSVVAKTFVLATGGIENPRLLLASNSRLPEGIGNQNDLVGRYFLEHPRFDAGVLLPFDSAVSNTLFYNDHHVSGDRIEGYLALPPELQQREELGDVQIRVEPVYAASLERALESEHAEAVRELENAIADRDIAEIGANLKAVASDLMTWQNFVIAGAPVPVPYPEVVGEVLDASAGELEARLPDFLGDAAAVVYRSVAPAALLESARLVSRIDPVPNKDSRVKLTSERDSLGVPRAELDWQLTSFDKRSARRTLEILAAEAGRAGVGRVKVLLEEEDDGTWPPDMSGGWHLIGTTRMSDDPKQGVVDRDLRVHGISNLYVTGSSVFPTSGSGTPTLTLVALTLRLGDHLLGESP